MNIDNAINEMLASYQNDGGINRNETENFPNRRNIINGLHEIQNLIFPGFRDSETLTKENLRYITGFRINKAIALLSPEIKKAFIYTISHAETDAPRKANEHCLALAKDTVESLIENLPSIRKKIKLDALAILHGDPAAKNIEEIILSYPGLEAILVHRIAHFLFGNGVPIIPRIMSEYIHGKTGIDIHPGAKIGESFFIDHGTGIVIGETCVIGNNVKLYQGVTLGALSVKKELMNKKRHPTIEDNVTIYANATILGGKTVIGHDSVIGGNSWITKSVPPHTSVE